MSKRRGAVSRLFLVIVLIAAAAGSFWFGLVPQQFSPFAPIALDQSSHWFLDPRLAAIRRDPALCKATLKPPHIEATPIPDNPIKNGCGWVNAVRVSTAGGAEIGLDKVTCEVAVALALWMEHDVQPLAQAMFGARVARLQDMGTYSCRNIVGNVFWKDFRSQHATANAYDIGGFTFTDGRTISVLRDWNGRGREAEFLREVHRRACSYFRVSLGPEFNRAHRDHFHFDRGFLWTCK
jgi:hypothetical protein